MIWLFYAKQLNLGAKTESDFNSWTSDEAQESNHSQNQQYVKKIITIKTLLLELRRRHPSPNEDC